MLPCLMQKRPPNNVDFELRSTQTRPTNQRLKSEEPSVSGDKTPFFFPFFPRFFWETDGQERFPPLLPPFGPSGCQVVELKTDAELGLKLQEDHHRITEAEIKKDPRAPGVERHWIWGWLPGRVGEVGRLGGREVGR